MAAHDEGLFELEGDADDSAAAGADWENGAEDRSTVSSSTRAPTSPTSRAAAPRTSTTSRIGSTALQTSLPIRTRSSTHLRRLTRRMATRSSTSGPTNSMGPAIPSSDSGSSRTRSAWGQTANSSASTWPATSSWCPTSRTAATSARSRSTSGTAAASTRSRQASSATSPASTRRVRSSTPTRKTLHGRSPTRTAGTTSLRARSTRAGIVDHGVSGRMPTT